MLVILNFLKKLVLAGLNIIFQATLGQVANRLFSQPPRMIGVGG